MKMTFKHTNRRDDNEQELLDFWRLCGCHWVQMLPGQGFDLLLFHRSAVYLVEIKNPARKWVLTPDEVKMQELAGDNYHIVENLEQAAKLIGAEL
jgi:hypothetical protein